jgi:mannitol/fructose-specific phosphotransferase system IIA component (Ntr-type)
VAPIWLIAEMGQLAILFTLGLVDVTVGWYFHYAAPRVDRAGATFHTFARLGQLRHGGLDLELRRIVEEKGLREGDGFDAVVARSEVIDFAERVGVERLVERAAAVLERMSGVPASQLEVTFLQEFDTGLVPVGRGVALPHMRVPGLVEPILVLARCSDGVDRRSPGAGGPDAEMGVVRAVVFLVSPKEVPGRHLRLLGHLATRVEDPAFLAGWVGARSASEVRATLLPDERLLQLEVDWDCRLKPGSIGRSSRSSFRRAPWWRSSVVRKGRSCPRGRPCSAWGTASPSSESPPAFVH